ncbi:hypothetical protein BC567DRAFT_250711 [Phyllosticta citribraziliensis]
MRIPHQRRVRPQTKNPESTSRSGRVQSSGTHPSAQHGDAGQSRRTEEQRKISTHRLLRLRTRRRLLHCCLRIHRHRFRRRRRLNCCRPSRLLLRRRNVCVALLLLFSFPRTRCYGSSLVRSGEVWRDRVMSCPMGERMSSPFSSIVPVVGLQFYLLGHRSLEGGMLSVRFESILVKDGRIFVFTSTCMW